MQTETFPGRFENLAKISEFVVRAAEEARLSPDAVYAVELAVDEACTNIIEHAYGGESNGNIEVTCKTTYDGLTVTLRDFGRPFNPKKIPNPNLKGRLKDLKSGGAGLYLIRKMMDEVNFDFTPNQGNTLTLVKRRS